MRSTLWIRLAVLIGLIGVLFGLTIWFGSISPAPDAGAYPGEAELATEGEHLLGERVVLGGQIIDTDPVTIRAQYDAGETIVIQVTDVEADVRVGDRLRVYGVVESTREIRALNAFTVPWWGTPYAVGISALAGLWVFVRTVRQWRFDADERALKRRESPLELTTLLDTGSTAPVGGNDDA